MKGCENVTVKRNILIRGFNFFLNLKVGLGLHMARRNNKNSKTFREKNWEGVCLGHFLENHPAASEIPAIF